MALLFGETIFDPGPAISGSKVRSAHCWRFCPYSTQSTDMRGDERIPEVEKTYHGETEGQMHSWSLGRGMGWICADNDCSFYTGAALTEVGQLATRFVPATGTGYDPTGVSGTNPCDPRTTTGNIEYHTIDRTVVAGTRYFEI